ncbi:helix-turn-helix domain-containing protein [Streptomyces ureilyticus]|uniref:Helix-turn-helix domain-containing protein n=1 Tax=Streptomyces ureilyticus TaxID=1775131 RepID=A0ABX0DVT9_9ACTN|nr:helix-turn-helix domain-containing protein [Streptomyces ureilyticus]NGO44393.1 helix-turn-helix domain-containing protein [Streptomyces ureilyticus]
MPVNADGLPEPAVPAPPPGLVTVGRFDERPAYSVNRPHGADSWLFTWTTGGHGRLSQGGVEARAGAGDLVVLGPDVPHRYAVAPGARHWAFWWVHCQARASWAGWLRPYARGDRLYVVTPAPDGVHDRVESAFRRMLADARWTGQGAPPGRTATPVATAEAGQVAVAHGAAARELALCSLESVVLLTAATARTEPQRSGIDVRIRRAEALIAADPGAPHTVESLAADVSLSPSRFAHLFSQQLGQSPMRAVLAARLLHAARLLEATDLPVERVAAASGFTSPYHFNRVFRQRYGTPPGAYRAGLRAP